MVEGNRCPVKFLLKYEKGEKDTNLLHEETYQKFETFVGQRNPVVPF